MTARTAPVRTTPSNAYEETLTDFVSAVLVARGSAATNLRFNDPVEIAVDITAENADDPALQVLITARALPRHSDAADPDIRGQSAPTARNAAMLCLTSDALVLLYRALGQAIAMAAKSGMVRLPADESGLPCTLPDPWRELRAVSAGAAATAAHPMVGSN